MVRVKRSIRRKQGSTATREPGKSLKMTEDSDQAESSFRMVSTPSEAKSLMDAVPLAPLVSLKEKDSHHHDNEKKSRVLMPCVGYGTYKLGKDKVVDATFCALECGYRMIDTAFIYGGETTEALVAKALQKALGKGTIQSRQDVFITTKHWRKYHGYEASFKCLDLSLKRLQVDYVDLWLMHWPGPAWKTMFHKKTVERWENAVIEESRMVDVRAETWRAMEDAYRKGLVKAIGVSNMTVQHLQTLKKTATLWPPAVNQVELHPLHPQQELLEYARKEGIVIQAYASLGGQDAGKKKWTELLGTTMIDGKKMVPCDFLNADEVVELASQMTHQDDDGTEGNPVTSAQLLLRWGLDRGCTLVPKTSRLQRMKENANIFDFKLSEEQVDGLQALLRHRLKENSGARGPDGEEDLEKLTRLCWRRDPLRHLDFE